MDASYIAVDNRSSDLALLWWGLRHGYEGFLDETALKFKMTVKWWNQPKNFLAATAALLTDLAYLPFVSDVLHWESGS